MSAPLPSDHPPWFTREHRPSVDVPSTSVQRPDLYRRHSAHPYEINPVTNRIIYREFDFSPVGSRAPISRTTKACNACRSRKVRCDAGGDAGEPSTCSRCREAGVECVYSGVQKKRGPCPGSARPSLGSRQPSQRVILTPPPELSPTFTSRSSYGFPPYEPADPYYLPPVTPNDPHPPSQSSFQQPGHPGPGWTSSQPRPLPTPSMRRPTTGNSAPHSRKPSVVSWHPSEIPEERSRMFDSGYSMQVLANESEMRAAEEARWRGEPYVHDQRQAAEVFNINQPGGGSAFGGDGRSLPPLRIALGGGSSYYEPRGK